MRLGLYSNKQAFYKKETRKIVQILKRHKTDFEVYTNLKKAKCDILIVVGGDGTILRAVMEMNKQIPILGVSKGIKFLTEIEFDEFEDSLKKILKRKYKIEEGMRLECEINGMDIPNALNDIVITSSKGGASFTISSLM